MKNLITAVAFLAFGYAASAQTVPGTNGTNKTSDSITTTHQRSKSGTNQEMYKSDTIHGTQSTRSKTDKSGTSTKSTKTMKKKKISTENTKPSEIKGNTMPNTNGTGVQNNTYPSGNNSGTTPSGTGTKP